MYRIFLAGFFLTAAACFAQHHPASGGSTSGGRASGGTVSAIPYTPTFGTGRNAPFPVRGTSRRGYYGGYPVFVGSYGSGFYGSDASYNPLLATPDAGPAAPAAPPVVINQYFGTPPPQPEQAPPADESIHMYSQPVEPAEPAAEPEPAPRTYLIAYRDHSVYTALAYWVEDHTLHYVTTANTHNQADLSLIDIDFTRKLNTDRNMTFNVPGAAH